MLVYILLWDQVCQNYCWWQPENPVAKNQLRLVVYPIMNRVSYILRACLGFLNHQQYDSNQTPNITSWWLSYPFEKYCSSILIIYPSMGWKSVKVFNKNRTKPSKHCDIKTMIWQIYSPPMWSKQLYPHLHNCWLKKHAANHWWEPVPEVGWHILIWFRVVFQSIHSVE